MPTPADRIETLRAQLAAAREGVDDLSAALSKPATRPVVGEPAGSPEQAEQIRQLQMQVAGLGRALDEARHSSREAERAARDGGQAAPKTATPPAGLNMELSRQVQEQLLEIESLRQAKARLSEERDRWRADARRFGGNKHEAKQQEETAREEAKRLRSQLADAVKRAQVAEKQVKQLERDLELEQRRQEHLRQHFMRKASG